MCRNSGNEYLTAKCNYFGAGRLLQKNGESFRVICYLEVQITDPVPTNANLEQLNWLNNEVATDAPQKILAEFLGNLVSRKVENSISNHSEARAPVWDESICLNRNNDVSTQTRS